jgi:hypothetical protein
MRPTFSLRIFVLGAILVLGASARAQADDPEQQQPRRVMGQNNIDSGGQEPGKREAQSQIEHSHQAPEIDTQSKLIPLPIYATQPNEGSTFGVMPVILDVDKKTERTISIWAPSYTWNGTIHNTGTFRWFHYPNDHQSLTITGGASTHVNYGGLVVWDNQPRSPQQMSDTVFFRWGRNIFYRFYGLGPDTTEGMESSHTRIKADLWYRKGYTVVPHLNIGARVEFARDVVQPIGVNGIPLSTDAFQGVPGMGGSTVASEALDIKYDTRAEGDYSAQGAYVDFSIGPSEGISQSPQYWSGSFEAKGLIEEFSGLQGGARLYWAYETDPNVPFYHQSSLGGSFLMRGFSEDRFFDQGAWTFEIEQRIRLLQLHIYGVTSEWRVDPFFAVGQVYDGAKGPFSHVREAGGLGFRAWVKPNVLGRVDVAIAGEGIATYVELGYPF